MIGYASQTGIDNSMPLCVRLLLCIRLDHISKLTPFLQDKLKVGCGSIIHPQPSPLQLLLKCLFHVPQTRRPFICVHHMLQAELNHSAARSEIHSTEHTVITVIIQSNCVIFTFFLKTWSTQNDWELQGEISWPDNKICACQWANHINA